MVDTGKGSSKCSGNLTSIMMLGLNDGENTVYGEESGKRNDQISVSVYINNIFLRVNSLFL